MAKNFMAALSEASYELFESRKRGALKQLSEARFSALIHNLLWAATMDAPNKRGKKGDKHNGQALWSKAAFEVFLERLRNGVKGRARFSGMVHEHMIRRQDLYLALKEAKSRKRMEKIFSSARACVVLQEEDKRLPTKGTPKQRYRNIPLVKVSWVGKTPKATTFKGISKIKIP